MYLDSAIDPSVNLPRFTSLIKNFDGRSKFVRLIGFVFLFVFVLVCWEVQILRFDCYRFISKARAALQPIRSLTIAYIYIYILSSFRFKIEIPGKS